MCSVAEQVRKRAIDQCAQAASAEVQLCAPNRSGLGVAGELEKWSMPQSPCHHNLINDW